MDTTKELIQSNAGRLVYFMNQSAQVENGKELAKQLSKALLPISRSIVGQDLVSLFKMIDKYGLTDESHDLLLSVAPNLMTIET